MEIKLVPDSLIFKVLVTEVWEYNNSYSSVDILERLISGSLEELCGEFFFRKDDNEVDQEEEFLVEWMSRKQGDEETRPLKFCNYSHYLFCRIDKMS